MNRSEHIFTYRDILDAQTPEQLTEASLGRMFQHVQGEDAFAVISAFRDALSPAENNRRHRQLKSEVRKRNLGFFEVKGVGQEEDGGRSEEKALVIPQIDRKGAQKLGGMFDQYAVLYKGPDTQNKVVMLEVQGGKEEVLGDFHPMKMGQFYSEVKGKPFTFESMPTNNSERLARARVGRVG